MTQRKSRRLSRRLIQGLAALAITAPLGSQGASAQAALDYVPADVAFMQGMIHHHAQAIQMCELAVPHGASAKVALLCKKILISQRDEIELMEHWLQDRGRTVPHPSTDTMALHQATSGRMASMPGMAHGAAADTLMPGMLTPTQMHALDQAHDTMFDRLLLTYMIQHHEGALAMVAHLFTVAGAGQGADIFAYATDVDAAQRGEINRMQLLLNPSSGSLE